MKSQPHTKQDLKNRQSQSGKTIDIVWDVRLWRLHHRCNAARKGKQPCLKWLLTDLPLLLARRRNPFRGLKAEFPQIQIWRWDRKWESLYDRLMAAKIYIYISLLLLWGQKEFCLLTREVWKSRERMQSQSQPTLDCKACLTSNLYRFA